MPPGFLFPGLCGGQQHPITPSPPPSLTNLLTILSHIMPRTQVILTRVLVVADAPTQEALLLRTLLSVRTPTIGE